MALKEGDRLLTLKSVVEAEKYLVSHTRSWVVWKSIDQTVSAGGGMLRMEKQKCKSPSMLNLFILMKRSKKTKGKAEHISFLVAKGRGGLVVWCSVLALKSARGFIQASRQTLYHALHLCCYSSAQILVIPP